MPYYISTSHAEHRALRYGGTAWKNTAENAAKAANGAMARAFTVRAVRNRALPRHVNRAAIDLRHAKIGAKNAIATDDRQRTNDRHAKNAR
jgi:hypothetical protein